MDVALLFQQNKTFAALLSELKVRIVEYEQNGQWSSKVPDWSSIARMFYIFQNHDQWSWLSKDVNNGINGKTENTLFIHNLIY